MRTRFPGCLIVARTRSTDGRLHRLVCILMNVLAKQQSSETCQTALVRILQKYCWHPALQPVAASLLDKEGLAPTASANSKSFQLHDRVSAFISSIAGSNSHWTLSADCMFLTWQVFLNISESALCTYTAIGLSNSAMVHSLHAAPEFHLRACITS